ncbi:MAG: HD domain-containing protein [Schwartzia sp.]|nr:HD domain-containing protein [Schwartzia sp. (in: firmicutes)]
MNLGRIRQFAVALGARLTEADRDFVRRWLTPEQRTLFFAMSVPDQYHALHVAYTARTLAAEWPGPVDEDLLTRAALLHDVGRRRGDLGTLGKSFAVLFAHFCSDRARAYGDAPEGSGLIEDKMRVYFHHAELGAAMLAGLGCGEEAAVVAAHHRAPSPEDPPELRLLRMADEKN